MPSLRSWLIPIVALFFAAVSAALGKSAYKVYTGEDGIAEVLQVIFFALALFFCLRAWKRVRNQRTSTIAAPFLVAALGLFFLLGEELSWGQRIFGWATPEDLARINRQDETNIHNLEGVHQAFRWIQLLIGAYGTLLPLWIRPNGWLKSWRDPWALYVPSPHHIPFFFPMFVWRIYKNLFPVPERFSFAIDEFNEVPELILAVGFFVFFRERARATSPEPAPAKPQPVATV